MLQRLNFPIGGPADSVLNVNGPRIINIYGKIKISVVSENDITIEGLEAVKIKTDELDLDARNISIQAEENLYIGAGKHLVQQAPRIDLNPEHDNSGYKK